MLPRDIAELRARTGMGMMDCKKALEWAKGDFDLAEGCLKYNGCAIAVKPKPGETEDEAYAKWVERTARSWAQAKRNEGSLWREDWNVQD